MILDATALEELAAIAAAAGATLLEYRSGPLEAQTKADGSPVTAADHAANAVILRQLAERFAGMPVVSEEGPPVDARAHAPRSMFLVDPLDGTKEFLAGRDEFTVNIALVEDGEPVAGIVHAPARRALYGGGRGQGAWRTTLEGGSLRARTPIKAVPAAGALRVITSRSHLDAETSAFIERYSVSVLQRAGSSLKFCLVAAGEADLYPRLDRTMEWDTAAGDAILRAAGGSVRTLDGAPLRYNKRGIPGQRPFSNPGFVAAGAFDPFDPRLRRGGGA